VASSGRGGVGGRASSSFCGGGRERAQ
jgi:hypothetical protein